MMPGSTHHEIVFYLQRFVRTWYRGHAHLDSDLHRFAITYRIPDDQKRKVFQIADLLFR